MKKKSTRKTVLLAALIVMTGLLLGLFSTSEYIITRGLNYIESGTQLKRHLDVLEGHAGSPWQYRVLAPYMISVVFTALKYFHIPNYAAVSFILFRVFQDTIILILSYEYYRKLGISFLPAIVGMAIMAWGMSYSHFDSDLSFNTFFDIIFYLLAGLCILQRRFVWIVPITFFAALNRETSGLIPFMLIPVAMIALPKGSLQKVMPVFVTAFLIYIAVFFGLRLLFGYQKPVLPYGHHAGLDLLQYNLFRIETWERLVATLSIIPILAIIGYKKWPLQLRLFFWVIVPVWFTAHLFSAVMAESRLFLVPQALVFIPGALLSLAQEAHAPEDAPAPLRRGG